MSNEEYRIPIREIIKRYVPISRIANIFNISRPTLYMFMQNYDDGELMNIPEDIKEFFDMITNNPQSEDVRIYLTMKDNSNADNKPIKIKEYNEKTDYYRLMNCVTNVNLSLSNIDRLISEKRKKVYEIGLEISTVESLIKQYPDDCSEYKMRIRSLHRKAESLETEIRRLVNEYESLSNYQKQTYTHETNDKETTNNWNIDDGLMTMCIGNDGKSMIIFQLSTNDIVDPEFTISLYIDTPIGEMTLATYRPGVEKNFVLIDDILPNIHAHYEVTCKHQDIELKTKRYPLKLR